MSHYREFKGVPIEPYQEEDDVNTYGFSKEYFNKLCSAIKAVHKDCDPINALKAVAKATKINGKNDKLIAAFAWDDTPQFIKFWEEVNDYMCTQETEMEKVNAIDIMQEAIELKKKKMADYQGGQFTEADYFPFGHTSFIHMLHTKMLRIRSVAERDGEQNFESLEDSLIDMINYAAMYAAWVRNNN